MALPLLLRLSALASAACLGACTSAPPTESAPASPPPAASAILPVPAGSATRYHIDPIASKLHILVYRGGTFARLGHNHVISSRTLQGTVWRGATLASSGFDISVPVNELVVDDNAARTEEGADFPLNLSDDAKEGTKANMLRETLLDGARYPTIRIQSVSVSGEAEHPVVLAALQIKSHTRHFTVPVTLKTTPSGAVVSGMFAIRQSDFGIQPLSLAMGALEVVDTVTIKFELVAASD